jgi:hypothetical protein
VFDPRPDEWVIANIQFGANRIDFHQLGNLTASIKHKLKMTLGRHAENNPYAHFQNIFSGFLAFYRAELEDLATPCGKV